MASKFKLQSVLNYRKTLEDQAQQRMTESLQKRHQLEQSYQHQEQALKRQDTELKERQRVGMTVAELTLFESHIVHCRRMMTDLDAQMKTLDVQIDREREELQKVAQDRQVMEKLKEKKEAEYQQELARQERIMLDEISLRIKGESL